LSHQEIKLNFINPNISYKRTPVQSGRAIELSPITTLDWAQRAFIYRERVINCHMQLRTGAEGHSDSR